MDAGDARTSSPSEAASIALGSLSPGPAASDVGLTELGPDGAGLAGDFTRPLAADGPVTDARPRVFASPASRSRLLSALVLWDAVVPVALLVLAQRFDGGLGAPLNGGAADIADPLALFLALICPLALSMAGAYNQRRRRGGSRLLFGMRLAVVAMGVSWVTLVVAAFAGWRVDLAQLLAVSLLLPPAWLLGRWACDRHPAAGPERTLLVGSGLVADRVLALTMRHRERRLNVVGRIETSGTADPEGPPLLGDLDSLPETLALHAIDRVIVAFADERDSELLDVLRLCVAAGVQVDVVPRFFDLVGPAPRAHSIGGLALVEVPGRGLTPSQRAAKRGLDIIGSLGLLLVFTPFMAATALAIAMFDGRPILFRQIRVGQQGRVFSIFKFRTMGTGADETGVGRAAAAADADADGSATAEGPIATIVRELKDTTEARVTPLGTILRKTSLDELPQLLNVLRGEMSLVGPRPLRPFEATALDPWQLARQDLRPGLTGLWQVLGRSNVDWDERMQLDYSYVSHWSFASDLRILARTLPAVLKRDGAV